MNTTLTNKDLRTHAFLLGDIVNRFCNLVAKDTVHGTPAGISGFDTFSQTFSDTDCIPKSLLVIRTEEDITADAAQDLNAFLAEIYGDHALMTKVGEREVAVMLLGYEQFSEVIPCVERISAYVCASHSSCTTGVARCPLDDHELPQLIAMASAAAAELDPNGEGFQFISRHHKYADAVIH